MMNVENMRLVVDVLESTKEPPALTEIAARRWSDEPHPLSYVRSSTTFIFTFHQGDQKRILRLQHSADTTVERSGVAVGDAQATRRRNGLSSGVDRNAI